MGRIQVRVPNLLLDLQLGAKSILPKIDILMTLALEKEHFTFYYLVLLRRNEATARSLNLLTIEPRYERARSPQIYDVVLVRGPTRSHNKIYLPVCLDGGKEDLR